MCRSISEGGQRCAAHTRPKYEAATFGTVDWDEAAAAFGSTPSGGKVLAAELHAAIDAGDTDRAVAFERAIRFGDQQREVAKATRAAIAQARQASQPTSLPFVTKGGYAGTVMFEGPMSDGQAASLADMERRFTVNEALGRVRWEYGENDNLVFDPYKDDGANAPRGTPSHKSPEEMAARPYSAADRERIDRDYWKRAALHDPESTRRTLETVNPELAARFDWTTGTYLGDDHAADDAAPVEGAEDASVSRLTAEGRALQDQAIAGVSPREAHRRAWRKYGYR